MAWHNEQLKAKLKKKNSRSREIKYIKRRFDEIEKFVFNTYIEFFHSKFLHEQKVFSPRIPKV